jgi:hypothetical protein
MAPIPASLQQMGETLPRHRPRNLGQLLGISDAEAEDYSFSGRVHIIIKLKAARSREIARGHANSWLYDVNRHLNLSAALRIECEALADFLSAWQRDELASPHDGAAAPIAGTQAANNAVQ